LPFTSHRPSPPIAVVPTWQSAPSDLLASRTVAVIDVLRWSTVVVSALANGAQQVEAHATPELARARAETLGRSRAILGGERNNLPLPGFDLGNSPLDYSRARVEGKTVVTTTTNGTHALLAARSAERVYVAAFVNLGATAAALADELRAGHAVTLLCSGQAGAETLEDTACAGAMLDSLMMSRALNSSDLDASARRALDAWILHERSAVQVLGAATHAKSLRDGGFELDVLAAGRVSDVAIVAAVGPDGAIRTVSSRHTG
jgi:2-phosphosulfolactate phosphatase